MIVGSTNYYYPLEDLHQGKAREMQAFLLDNQSIIHGEKTTLIEFHIQEKGSKNVDQRISKLFSIENLKVICIHMKDPIRCQSKKHRVHTFLYSIQSSQQVFNLNLLC